MAQQASFELYWSHHSKGRFCHGEVTQLNLTEVIHFVGILTKHTFLDNKDIMNWCFTGHLIMLIGPKSMKKDSLRVSGELIWNTDWRFRLY